MEIIADKTKIAIPQNLSDYWRVKELIELDGSLIQYVFNESKELIEIAMRQDPLNICYIRNQIYKLSVDAVIKNTLAFPFVDKKTAYLSKIAIKESPCMERYTPYENLEIPLKRKDKKIRLRAKNIEEIDNIDEKLTYLKSESFHIFGYLLDQPKVLCEAAINENAFNLACIRNQTKHLCMLAVRKNGMALKLVENQTENICKIAVKKNGLAIRYVKSTTPEIDRLAVKENPIAYFYIENKTTEIQRLAVAGCFRILSYIDNPTTELIEIGKKSQDLNDKKLHHLYKMMPVLYNKHR